MNDLSGRQMGFAGGKGWRGKEGRAQRHLYKEGRAVRGDKKESGREAVEGKRKEGNERREFLQRNSCEIFHRRLIK